MTRLFTSVLVINLSMLMLIGSGFSLYKHYCGGNLKTVTVNHTSPTCHDMAAEVPACHAMSVACHAPESDSDDCCDNQVTWQQTDQFILSVPAILQQDWTVISAVAATLHYRLHQHVTSPIAYLHYHPPLLCDYEHTADLQVFRL